jgi:hypothetical protein
MAAEREFRLRFANGREFGPVTIAIVEQWASEGRVPRDAVLAPVDGLSPPQAVTTVASLAQRVVAPPTMATRLPVADDLGITGMIPYRNQPALIGYYAGLFSICPLVGLVLAPAAIVLGIGGLRVAAADATRRGKVHAWVGIIGGIAGCLINFGCLVPGGILAILDA